MNELGPRTLDERHEQLGRAIAREVARGARVEAQGTTSAVLVRGKPVNHTLHLILTLLTFGGWALVWPFLAIFGGEKRYVVSVDEYGNELVER